MKMSQPRLLATALLVCALALVGCDSVKEAGRDAAQQVASDVTTDQVCRLVADGRITGDELDRLDDLVSRAEGMGLPADVLQSAKDLVARVDGATENVADLVADCDRADEGA